MDLNNNCVLLFCSGVATGSALMWLYYLYKNRK